MSSDRRYTAYTIMEMKTRTITPILTGFLAACALGGGAAGLLPAQSAPETPGLKIEAGKPGPAVNLRYGRLSVCEVFAEVMRFPSISGVFHAARKPERRLAWVLAWERPRSGNGYCLPARSEEHTSELQ